jgi:hypothetical protein
MIDALGLAGRRQSAAIINLWLLPVGMADRSDDRVDSVVLIDDHLCVGV